MLALIVTVLVCIGIASAAIASHKRRDVVGWFFIGFFFGVLGIVLAIVLPPNPLPIEVAAPSVDTIAPPLDGAARAVYWWKLDAK